MNNNSSNYDEYHSYSDADFESDLFYDEAGAYEEETNVWDEEADDYYPAEEFENLLDEDDSEGWRRKRPDTPRRRPAARQRSGRPRKNPYHQLKGRLDALSRAMKKLQLDKGNLASNKHLYKKLKGLEEAFKQHQNNSVLSTLLGEPKLSEITFADGALGTQQVNNSEYNFPMLQLLLNSDILGGEKGNSLEGILPLLLLSGGNGLGGGNLLPLLLFSQLFNKK